MTEKAIEQGIKAKGLTAPRLTPNHIDEQIRAVAFHQFHEFPGTTVTVCLLTLRNGAKVSGYNCGAIDPEQQNWEQGKNAAYSMALEKVWELEGYLLRDWIHANERATQKVSFEQGLNGTCAADLAHVHIVGEDTGTID